MSRPPNGDFSGCRDIYTDSIPPRKGDTVMISAELKETLTNGYNSMKPFQNTVIKALGWPERVSAGDPCPKCGEPLSVVTDRALGEFLECSTKDCYFCASVSRQEREARQAREEVQIAERELYLSNDDDMPDREDALAVAMAELEEEI
jgi:hypothetical protein